MAFRLYIVPVIIDQPGTSDESRGPKYFFGAATRVVSASANWSAVDYGFEPWMVVGADLSASDDNAVVAQVDVQALPLDLAANLTSQQVTNVKTFLENAHIPAGWITTADTWIHVVRVVLGLFLFLQRYGYLYAQANGVAPPSLFNGGVSLATTFGSLSAAVQSALTATAVDQGISTAGLTASTTLRVILKTIADTYQGRQYNFNGTLI